MFLRTASVSTVLPCADPTVVMPLAPAFNALESGDVSSVITQLVVYPVKSCAGVALQQAALTDTGLAYDRAWMVVDARGEFLTQRELPRMALIQPQLKTYEMVLKAPGMLALHIALDAVDSAVTVRLWGDDVAAFDMGTVAAQWFTDFLGTPARLVRFDPDHPRLSDTQWTAGVAAFNQFNDGFALLVLGQSSLDDFNVKLMSRGELPVTMARFRPNLVLGSAPGFEPVLPYDEDWLDTLHIDTDTGRASLRMVKPCARCPIPNLDPRTALMSPQVGELLQSYRADARLNGALTFGMNAIVLADPHLPAGAAEPLLKVGQRVVGRYRFD